MCLQHRFDFPCRISTWLCNLARLVSATHVLAQQLHWSGTYKGKHCAPATLQAAGCVHSHRMQGVGNGRKSVLGADACDASLAVVELLLSLSVPLATAEGDQIIFARNKPSKQNPATPPNTVLHVPSYTRHTCTGATSPATPEYNTPAATALSSGHKAHCRAVRHAASGPPRRAHGTWRLPHAAAASSLLFTKK